MDIEKLFDFNSREHKINALQELKSIKFDTLDTGIQDLLSNLNRSIDSSITEISDLQSKLSDYGTTNNGIPYSDDLDIFDKQFELHYKQHCRLT